MKAATNSRILRAIPSLVVVCLLSIPTEAKYGGGSGTAEDPYQIWTPEQMNTIGAEPNDWDRHFKLMADIDLAAYTGTDFNIIGYRRSWADNEPFSGIFDGNHHTISNFHYTSTDVNGIGLFQFVADPNAHILDLELVDPEVDAAPGSNVGSLVGWFADGCVTGCHVREGSVSGNHGVGGAVGYNGGTIADCTSSSSISAAGWIAGGLVGCNSGTISDCRSTGEVSGAGGGVGGLVGANTGGSYLTPSGSPIGYVVGTITRCYATGTVVGNNDVGGLVGMNRDGEIRQCYCTGEVSGDSVTGGLVGSNGGTVTNCYSIGSSLGSKGVGGLVGLNLGAIQHCYAVGGVSGDAHAGGLVGLGIGTVTASVWDIEASGEPSSDGGTGKTTAEMHMAGTFLDVGWDLINVWGIGENQTYPYLREYSAADIDQDGNVNSVDLAVLAENWLGSIAP